MATRKKAGAKREVDLAAMVASGPQGAYEASQLFRSRALRLKSKNDIEGSLKAAADGAICLLEAGYENAGAELAEIYVELLIEVNKPVTDENKEVIFAIESKFPPKSNRRVELLKSCLKWSVSSGNRELGDAALHRKLAECLWDINASDRSSTYHFAAGEAPLSLLKRVQGAFANSKESRDQAITAGVVHFLSLENLRDANELFAQYLKEEGIADKSNYSELLTFCDYLLQTCLREAGPLFKQLVNAYASTLDFDDNVPTLLTGPIAFKFFGIKPKVNPMMSMLQSMMS